MTDKEIRCGFCGEVINGLSRPIAISFEIGDGEFQNLYCHQGCLYKALHPSAFSRDIRGVVGS